jgi:hypothetical protein
LRSEHLSFEVAFPFNKDINTIAFLPVGFSYEFATVAKPFRIGFEELVQWDWKLKVLCGLADGLEEFTQIRI